MEVIKMKIKKIFNTLTFLCSLIPTLFGAAAEDFFGFECPPKIQALETFSGPVSFSADGRLAIVPGSKHNNKAAYIWKVGEIKCAKVLQGHPAPITSASLSPNGTKAITGSAEGEVIIWDLTADGKDVLTWDSTTGNHFVIPGRRNSVTSTSFSQDGTTALITKRFESTEVWDTNTGRCTTILNKANHYASSAYFLSDGMVVTSGESGKTCIWELPEQSDTETITLKAPKDGFSNKPSFSGDGQLAVTVDDGARVLFWGIGGRCLHILRSSSDSVYRSASFSHYGPHVITISSDNTAKIWNWELKNQRSITIRTCSKDFEYSRNCSVNSNSFSPDGRSVIIVSPDNVVRIYDIETGDCTETLSGHTDWISSAYFLPDGRHIVTCSSDCVTKIWDLRPEAAHLYPCPAAAAAAEPESDDTAADEHKEQPHDPSDAPTKFLERQKRGLRSRNIRRPFSPITEETENVNRTIDALISDTVYKNLFCPEAPNNLSQQKEGPLQWTSSDEEKLGVEPSESDLGTPQGATIQPTAQTKSKSWFRTPLFISTCAAVVAVTTILIVKFLNR